MGTILGRDYYLGHYNPRTNFIKINKSRRVYLLVHKINSVFVDVSENQTRKCLQINIGRLQLCNTSVIRSKNICRPNGEARTE